MRKLICVLTAVLVCASLVCPVLAAEDFVPSISYKGTPEVLTIKDANGNDAVAAIRDASGAITGYVYDDCMRLTPVARYADDDKLTPEEKAELQEAYQGLVSGNVKLPYAEGVNAAKMVIRDLFNVSWHCTHDHDAMLEEEGVVIEMTFDLGVDADKPVAVMTYKNDTWANIAKVVNNGDGTVTCTFEHLCPVAITVEGDDSVNQDTGDAIGSGMHLWIVLMVVSAAAVVMIATSRRKVQ